MSECKCDISSNMSYEELMRYLEVRGSCTESKNKYDSNVNSSPGWICSTFLKELNRASAEKRSKDYRLRKSSGKARNVTGSKKSFPSNNQYTKRSLDELV